MTDPIPHIRYQGYSLEEKWRWVSSGLGADAVSSAAHSLTALGNAMASSAEELRSELRKAGVEWDGAAATAATSSLTRAGAWANTAGENSDQASSHVTGYGASFAATRSRMPNPATIGPQGWQKTALNVLDTLAGTQINASEQAAARQNADQEANRLLRAHEDATRSALAQIPDTPAIQPLTNQLSIGSNAYSPHSIGDNATTLTGLSSHGPSQLSLAAEASPRRGVIGQPGGGKPTIAAPINWPVDPTSNTEPSATEPSRSGTAASNSATGQASVSPTWPRNQAPDTMNPPNVSIVDAWTPADPRVPSKWALGNQSSLRGARMSNQQTFPPPIVRGSELTSRIANETEELERGRSSQLREQFGRRPPAIPSVHPPASASRRATRDTKNRAGGPFDNLVDDVCPAVIGVPEELEEDSSGEPRTHNNRDD